MASLAALRKVSGLIRIRPGLSATFTLQRRLRIQQVFHGSRAARFCSSSSSVSPLMINGVDWNDPKPKLIDENASLGYKLFHQKIPYSAEDRVQYDAFHEKLWYGEEGKESVTKLLNFTDNAFPDDLNADYLTLRDYETNVIFGANMTRRHSSKLKYIFPTLMDSDLADKSCNYILRINTVIDPAYQSKGYGKIIRKFSSDLETKFLNDADCGFTCTEIQNKNQRSMKLQIKSGLGQIAKLSTYLITRNSSYYNKLSASADFSDIIEIDPKQDKDRFLQISDLNEKYLIQNEITTFGGADTARSLTDKFKICAITAGENGARGGSGAGDDIIAAFIVKEPIRTVPKPKPGLEEYAMILMNKIYDGVPAPEQTYDLAPVVCVYLKGLQADGTLSGVDNKKVVEKFVKLAEYCALKTKVQSQVLLTDSKHPLAKFVDKNSIKICGYLGTLFGEKENISFMAKTVNMPEECLDLLKKKAVSLPQPVCSVVNM